MADPILIVCRDILGEHVGGHDCWCCPHVLCTEEEIQRFLDEIANHPEREVS